MPRPDMIQADLRALVGDLALDLEIRPGRCRHWTDAHLQVAVFHGLAPWLYYSLRRCPDPELDCRFLKELQTRFYLSVKASISRDNTLNQLLAAWNQAGIKVVLLKGTYLAHCVYDDPVLRLMNDIDSVVPDSDFKSAADVLVAFGCEGLQQLPASINPLPAPSVGYSHPDGVLVPVDLHWELRSMNYYRISWPTIWEEARETTIFGLPCHVLSRELNFIHLALHSLNHSPMLRDWLDMLLVLRGPDFDWDRLLFLARLLGVQRPLHWVLDWLAREWKLQPPLHVDEELRAHAPRWIEDRIIRSRFRYLWQVASGMMLVPGWSARMQYAFCRIFPPTSYIESACGTRSWLAYLNSKISHFRHIATR